MKFLFLKISIILWIQLSLAEENCEPYRMLQTNDEKILLLNCFSAANPRLQCIKEKLDEQGVRINITNVEVTACESWYALSGKQILKELDLPFLKKVQFETKNKNQKIESDVSVLNGVQKLEFDVFEAVDSNILENYQSTRALKLLQLTNEIPDNLFSKLNQLKKLWWTSSSEENFQQELIIEVPQLEHITINVTNVSDHCKQFPLTFTEFVNLKELVLSGTFGTCIAYQDLFKGAYNLESLKIVSNSLSKLPDQLFDDQTNLIRLDLSSNGLKTVQKRLFEKLTKLQFLNLSNNVIRTMDLESPLLPSLVMLDFSYNRPRYAEAKLKIQLKSSNFKIIQLEGGLVHYFLTTDAVICGFHNKCHFVQDHNETKCPEKCKCDYDRETNEFTIDCGHQDLTEIPKLPIPNIGNVTLRIYYNRIEKLPDNTHYGYSNIGKLYAGSNKITSFSVEQIPTKAKVIDLNNNDLGNINAEVVRFFKQRQDIDWHYKAKVKNEKCTFWKSIF